MDLTMDEYMHMGSGDAGSFALHYRAWYAFDGPSTP
jgi:hypothetical protein